MGFLDTNFILTTETAKKLYHAYAAQMPIIDYHCHVNPREIYEDKKFENITELWLGGDHYKWRLMRSNGVDEYYITGGAEPREKFRKFAETLPLAIGNPMYHWCHLELKNYFGYEGVLNGDTADLVYDLCAEKLKEDTMSVRGLIKQSNVVRTQGRKTFNNKVVRFFERKLDFRIFHKGNVQVVHVLFG